MTAEMQALLAKEMDDALALDEPRRSDAILTVLTHQLHALIDCQRKTADRVKELVREKECVQHKAEGAKAVLVALYAVGSTLGTTVAFLVLRMLGVSL